ncbi:MAG: hypothetical protein JNK34_13115 [Tabrizicola sp.]|nr:hypothetical protein [Tabrizicola sp.]
MNSDKPTNPNMAQQIDKSTKVPVEKAVSDQPAMQVTPTPMAEAAPVAEKS